MKVFLRPPDGKKKDDVEIDIDVDELIESVRRKVHEKKGIDCHKLVYRGSTLKDDRTLRSYDVAEGSTLIVQAQFYNQYLPMGVTPAMEKRSAEEAQLEVPEALAPEAKRAATDAAAVDVTLVELPAIKARAATHGEKGMRRQMEDEHLICASMKQLVPSLPEERDFALFAIFDGHGGKQVAQFIKTYLAVELANAFNVDEEAKEEALSTKKMKKCVEATFQRLDSRIATELTGCDDGCTASVLLVNEEIAVCANLGDSMAYLCRDKDGDNQAIPLQLRQHKCWMMKEKERILRSGGAVENGRINGVLEVSRAFGDIMLKKYGVLVAPELMKFKIEREKDQFILIGCDGFWNAWSPAEALEHTQQLLEAETSRAEQEEDKIDIKRCCQELVQYVIEEKKAQDNVTVLLVQFLK